MLLDGIPNVFNATELLTYNSWGFLILLVVVFAETGLFFGFFLPGDALLFTAGLLVATGDLKVDFWTLLFGLNIVAVGGNMLGYATGKRAGKKWFTREDSLLFRKRHVTSSEKFFHQYGGIALILARFLPIVRTFAPIVAGIARYNYLRFMVFNIAGSLLWTIALTASAYLLGKEFPGLKAYLNYIIFGMIFLASGTLLRAWWKERKNRLAENRSHSEE